MENKGKIGDNVNYEYYDGILVIKGSGRMKDEFVVHLAPSPFADIPSPFKDNKEIRQIIISEGVENIGGFMFFGCSSLESVFMADSVKEIGNYAFCGCEGLEFVFLSHSLFCIRDGAFNKCTSLRSIEIPEGVKWIESSAFSGCSSLCAISLPESLEEIEDGAFICCDNLKRYLYTRAKAAKWEKVKLGGSGFCDDDFYCSDHGNVIVESEE